MGSGASKAKAPTEPLKWGIVGNLTIRTLKYSGLIDQSSDSTKIKLPKSRVVESKLSWVNHEYVLEDLRTIDFDTGHIVEFPPLQARFRITHLEEFENLIDTEELVSSYSANIKKALNESQKTMLIEKVTNQCKEVWNYTHFIWIKHKESITKKQVKHCGLNCIELNFVKDASPNELTSYIQSKYAPDVIGELSRKVKAKLIMGNTTRRPHLCNIRKSSYAELKKGDQIKSEVREELTLMVYCWEDIPELGSENFIKGEIRKMNEIIKFQSNEFNQRLNHRLKSKFFM